MSKKDYTDVLLEGINGKFDRLLEVIIQMRNDMKGMARQDLEEVKADVKVIKAVLTDTNVQVRDHETRITELETA